MCSSFRRILVVEGWLLKRYMHHKEGRPLVIARAVFQTTTLQDTGDWALAYTLWYVVMWLTSPLISCCIQGELGPFQHFKCEVRSSNFRTSCRIMLLRNSNGKESGQQSRKNTSLETLFPGCVKKCLLSAARNVQILWTKTWFITF
jgi:hypothetical protein